MMGRNIYYDHHLRTNINLNTNSHGREEFSYFKQTLCCFSGEVRGTSNKMVNYATLVISP